MIVALAGRRIDEPGAKERRFPLENINLVEANIEEYLRFLKPDFLICSAACGADLLALKVAGELHINRRIILPFSLERFKEKSVDDRPGDWGKIFDQVLQDLRSDEEITILNFSENDQNAYQKTNIEILNQAEGLSQNIKANTGTKEEERFSKLALIMWEGYPKASKDTTKHFIEEAQKRGFEIREIITS